MTTPATAQPALITTISAAELPAIGQPLAGGIYAGRYWLNGEDRALILLPDELESAWGEYGKEVVTSYSDGQANTVAMAEAGSELAGKVLELDAFIPSCLEGQLLMAAKHAGLITLREDHWHWLSTQYSADNAFIMVFDDGYLGDLDKDIERLVRPVRSLLIQ